MIVRYIQRVYSPTWFHINSHWKFTASPSNTHLQMKLVMNQPEKIQQIVKPVLQRNGQFADPAILLCSMLEHPEERVRTKAVNIINGVRANPPKPPRARVCRGIRKHIIPPLQYESDNWWDIINWDAVKVYEPRILQRISAAEINATCGTPMTFPKYPCHSQSVERAVKLVSIASGKVCGLDKRHGFILSTIKNRKERKPFETKKDYKYST